MVGCLREESDVEGNLGSVEGCNETTTHRLVRPKRKERGGHAFTRTWDGTAACDDGPLMSGRGIGDR